MARVLTVGLQDWGPVLATRNKGRAAAATLADLAGRYPERLIAVSAANCEAATPPFLQELIRALDDAARGRWVFCSLNEDIAETLQFVVERERRREREQSEQVALQAAEQAATLQESFAVARRRTRLAQVAALRPQRERPSGRRPA